jgi:hypothetical protein
VGHHLHPGEELLEVAGDDALERNPGVIRDPHEAGQHLLRHLDARERVLVGDGVAHQDREAERQIRDVRERPSRSDGERCEHREDLLPEALGDDLALLRAAFLAGDDPDALLLERGANRALEHLALALELLARALGDAIDRLRGRQAVGPARVHARVDLVVQTGDADHEELVKVAREDRQEPEALQQRHAVAVLRELQHAVVELDPGDLTVPVERACGRYCLGLLRGPDPFARGGSALVHSRLVHRTFGSKPLMTFSRKCAFSSADHFLTKRS